MCLISRWKKACDNDNAVMQRHLLGELQAHTSRYLEHLNIPREAFEAQGLGLQPLTRGDGSAKTDRHELALRYYRIAQWQEHLLGSDWTAVGFLPSIAPITAHKTGPRFRRLQRLFPGLQVGPRVVSTAPIDRWGPEYQVQWSICAGSDSHGDFRESRCCSGRSNRIEQLR